MIVTNARAKPLDPSLPQGAGVVPTGAKVGIDATIPEGIPKEHYERITYAYADKAKIDDYVERQGGRRPARPATRPRSRRWRRRSSQRSRRSRSTTPTSPSAFRRYDFRTVARAHRPSARDREAVAGPARPHVRARLRIRRQAAAEVSKVFPYYSNLADLMSSRAQWLTPSPRGNGWDRGGSEWGPSPTSRTSPHLAKLHRRPVSPKPLPHRARSPPAWQHCGSRWILNAAWCRLTHRGSSP